MNSSCQMIKLQFKYCYEYWNPPNTTNCPFNDETFLLVVTRCWMSETVWTERPTSSHHQFIFLLTLVCRFLDLEKCLEINVDTCQLIWRRDSWDLSAFLPGKRETVAHSLSGWTNKLSVVCRGGTKGRLMGEARRSRWIKEPCGNGGISRRSSQTAEH